MKIIEYEVILSYYTLYRWIQQGTWKFHCSGHSLLILNVLFELFVIMPKSKICIDVGFISNDLVTTQIYRITHVPNAWNVEFYEEKGLFEAVCRVTMDYRLSHCSPIRLAHRS